MRIELRYVDARLLLSAMNWCMNVPFERSSPIVLDKEDTARLTRLEELLINEVDRIHSCCTDPRGKFPVQPIYVISDPEYLALAHQCADAFFAEIGHSPGEVSAVTGFGVDALTDLVIRLRNICSTE